MNRFEAMREIKTPETWKASAKALWNQKTPRRGPRRYLRPLPVAAAIACLLVGTAAAIYAISDYRNAIIVKDEAEMRSVAMELWDGDEEHPLYSASAPAPASEQLPLSGYIEAATYVADHWQDDTEMERELLGPDQVQDWTFAGYDVSEGPLWKRHAVTSAGWYKAQYVAEAVETLGEADPASIVFDLGLEDTDLAPIPHGNSLEIVKDADGRLLGAEAKLTFLADGEKYFQMEYSYEANAIDWGVTFVMRDEHDYASAFTTADGREFVITTSGDRLWAESVTPNETYFCYGIRLSIEEAEAILNDIRLEIPG